MIPIFISIVVGREGGRSETMFLTEIAWISLISQLTSDHPFGRTNVNRDPKPSTLKSETALEVDQCLLQRRKWWNSHLCKSCLLHSKWWLWSEWWWELRWEQGYICTSITDAPQSQWQGETEKKSFSVRQRRDQRSEKTVWRPLVKRGAYVHNLQVFKQKSGALQVMRRQNKEAKSAHFRACPSCDRFYNRTNNNERGKIFRNVFIR